MPHWEIKFLGGLFKLVTDKMCSLDLQRKEIILLLLFELDPLYVALAVLEPAM